MAGLLEYGVKLADQMSGPAQAASSSISTLTQSLTKAKTELAEYQAQLTRAKTLGDVEGYRKYTSMVDTHRRKVFDLTGSLEGLRPAAAAAAEQEKLAAEAMGGLTSVMTAGVGILASVGGALAGLALEGAKLALEQADLREHTVTLFDAFSDAPGAGEKAVAAIRSLSGPLAQTDAQLTAWAEKYEALGITDLTALRGQLTATASATALVGASGADAYEALTTKIQEAIDTHHGLKLADKSLAGLARTGVNVSLVAQKMGLDAKTLRDQLKAGTVDAARFGNALQAAIIEKGAKPLAQQTKDLPVQMAHLADNFKRMFSDIDTSPLTDGVAQVLSEFEEGMPIARGLHFAIKETFDGLFSLVKKVAPEVELFFLNLEIAALKGYIMVKPLTDKVASLLGTDGGGVLRASLKFVTVQLEIIVSTLANALDMIDRFFRVSKAISKGDLGGAITEGLTTGLNMNRRRVNDAGEEIGGTAKAGIAKSLDIHSPSRVAMQLGSYTGLGLAMGIEGGARDTERASSQLGAVAARSIGAGAYSGVSAGIASPYGSAGSSGGQQIHIHVGGIHLSGTAEQGAQELTEMAFAVMMERIALQQGLG